VGVELSGLKPLGAHAELGEQRQHMGTVDEKRRALHPAVRVHPLFKSAQQFRGQGRWCSVSCGDNLPGLKKLEKELGPQPAYGVLPS